jgi:hypothetical protein
MFGRYSRALALVAIVALIGNAQCFGNCASSVCSSPKTPASGCHDHKPSHDDTASCSHQHFQLAGPETGIAKFNIVAAVGILPVLVLDSAAVSMESHFSQFDTGSPPGDRPCSTICILRI